MKLTKELALQAIEFVAALEVINKLRLPLLDAGFELPRSEHEDYLESEIKYLNERVAMLNDECIRLQREKTDLRAKFDHLTVELRILKGGCKHGYDKENRDICYSCKDEAVAEKMKTLVWNEGMKVTKDEFDLIKGNRKIQAIKEIRARTGLGLKESKEIADRVTE